MLKQALKMKLKDMPEAEREKMLVLIEKNPELFQKIALEIQEEMKRGKSEMDAAMTVMPKYQSELQKLNQ